MHAIELKHISKVYQACSGPVPALSDLSLCIGRGEFLAVTGPSGCGKSTLLHIIGGLDMPTSGSVCVDGKPLYGKTQAELAHYRRKEAGIVYQSYNLVPELTAEENLILPALMNRETADIRQVNRILDFLGMGHKRRLYPAQLSGGQQQKIAIGRALIQHPAILLADEPTGNLDSSRRDEILELFRYLNLHEAMTVLLVTHDAAAALAAKRKLIMLDGKIIKDEVIQ